MRMTHVSQLDVLMPAVGAAHAETLQMRQWVVKSFLDREVAYVAVLGILMQVAPHAHMPLCHVSFDSYCF